MLGQAARFLRPSECDLPALWLAVSRSDLPTIEGSECTSKRGLDEHVPCLGLVQPYRKQSAAHVFIAWIVDGILYEATTGLDLEDRQRTLKTFAEVPEALDDLQ